MNGIRLQEHTSFTKIKLTDLDVIQGQSLSQQQKDVIQNRRADIAEEIINLTYSEDKNDKYALNLAYLQGQLQILTLQLSESDAATNFITSTSEDN